MYDAPNSLDMLAGGGGQAGGTNIGQHGSFFPGPYGFQNTGGGGAEAVDPGEESSEADEEEWKKYALSQQPSATNRGRGGKGQQGGNPPGPSPYNAPTPSQQASRSRRASKNSVVASERSDAPAPAPVPGPGPPSAESLSWQHTAQGGGGSLNLADEALRAAQSILTSDVPG